MKETYLEPAGRLEVYERCDVLSLIHISEPTRP